VAGAAPGWPVGQRRQEPRVSVTGVLAVAPWPTLEPLPSDSRKAAGLADHI